MLPRRLRLCHHCCVPITAEDGEHYGYQCHACAVREHDLVLLAARDPQHPDLAWLDTVPVETGNPGEDAVESGRRSGPR